MFLLGLLLFVSSTAALKQLSFSGGGSFGAVEIGILKRVVETDNKSSFTSFNSTSFGEQCLNSDDD